MPSYPTSYLPPPSGVSPFTDITNYNPHCPYGDASSSTNAYDATPCSSESFSEPFLVKMLNGRIKVCGGCKDPHLKNADNEVLPPPHDICLGHREPLSFVNPHNGLECSKLLPHKFELHTEKTSKFHFRPDSVSTRCTG